MDVRRFAACGATLFVAACLMDRLPAAPFVLGAPRPLAERIAEARSAVVAAPAGGQHSSQWRIATCLRDLTGELAAGQVIRRGATPSPDQVGVLLIARRDGLVQSVPLSKAMRAYLQELPMPKETVETRLRYALAHLDASDPHVAADAYAVVAGLSAKTLRAHRDLLPAETLREFVASSATEPQRLGLFAYLLGLAGGEEDAALIRQRLSQNHDGLAAGVPGLVAGYLLLTEEDGLARLEGTILLAERRSPLFVAGLFEALETLARVHPELIPAKRLRQTACCGLQREDAADLAIGFLASQRAWQALPSVVRLLHSDDDNAVRRRSVQITAVRFLLACRRDKDASSAIRAKASSLLKHLAQSDRDLLRRARRIAGPVPRGN